MSSDETASIAETSAGDIYQDEIDHIEGNLATLERRVGRFSILRGVTFLPSACLAIYTWQTDLSPMVGYTLSGLFFIAFLVVASLQERDILATEQAKTRRRIYRQQRARRRRDWDSLTVREPESITPREQDLAVDLNLFGRNSVLQWLSIARTPLGRRTLSNWLLSPATSTEVALRQDVVRRLSPNLELWEAVQLRGDLIEKDGAGTEEFLSWVERPAWLGRQPWLLRWAQASAAAVALVLIYSMVAGLSQPAVVALGVLIVLNAVTNIWAAPHVQGTINLMAAGENKVSHFVALFDLMPQLPQDLPRIETMLEGCGPDGRVARQAMRDLRRRASYAAARNSSLWGIPYLVLQYMFLADFHVIAHLEAWANMHRHHAREWFRAVAELECFVSLAAIARDNPDWCFPSVHAANDIVRCRAMGHPLIGDDTRVCNDIEIGPANTFLLVSGSNMSGKSTFLRSIGVNLLLSQTGGPVCATDFATPPMRVATSMKIGDSLADGVSLFMAELKRLKSIVDEATAANCEDEFGLFYLLDEILHGTNSAERHLAVLHVIQHLMAQGALGAVSTHDLELARSKQLEDCCQPVHFCEHFRTDDDGSEQMLFDYQLQTGVSTSTNALKLLEMVGLGTVHQAPG